MSTQKFGQIQSCLVDRTYLEYTYLWSGLLLKAKETHYRWLNLKEDKFLNYLLIIAYCNSFVLKLREVIDKVQTTSRLPLPFAVEWRFKMLYLKK